MDDLNAILEKKLKEKSQLKVQTLADRKVPAPKDGLSSLNRSKLTKAEEESLEELLHENALDQINILKDLDELKVITEEVKSINTQSIILHGERIKRAQTLLKEYKSGTFSQWLLQTYGNRQTPYNFLQYFEFYQSLTASLQEKMLDMPKQAVYTLASRSGDVKEKAPFIEQYKGESKEELLTTIRKAFPLKLSDKRKENFSSTVYTTLFNLLKQMKQKKWIKTPAEKQKINEVLTQILLHLND